MGNSGIDSNFSFGLDTTQGFAEALLGIEAEAKKYRTAIEQLKLYFNEENLWKGEDAQALLTEATKTDGPLEKLKVVGDELDNLAGLAKSLEEAVYTAQSTLKGNVTSALGGGTNNG